jgi:hypothetical protein
VKKLKQERKKREGNPRELATVEAHAAALWTAARKMAARG